MSRKNSTAVVGEEPLGKSGVSRPQTPRGGGGSGPPKQVARGTRGPGGGGGLFAQYKPEQGIWTRRGTFIGAAALIAWGTKFVYDRLLGYQGDEWWRVLIVPGIPILFALVFGTIAWRISFSNRGSGDFMIATEGEMKKVSWSTKHEVIGSTIVVLVFTLLMALLLFVVDLAFQSFFRSIDVLKV